MSKVLDTWGGFAPRKHRLTRVWESGKDWTEPRPFQFKEAWYLSLDYGSAPRPTGKHPFWDIDGGDGSSAYTRVHDINDGAALNKLYEKLRESSYESLQLGVDFFQGRETLRLLSFGLEAVRRPLQTMGSALRKHARRSKDAWHMPLHTFSDVWLPFVYGVKPTMDTAYTLVNMYNSRRTQKHRVRERVSVVETRSSSSATSSMSWTNRRDISGGFEFHVSNPNLFQLEQLGFLNPVSFAWELVPYSFVLDWFIPFGRWASQLTDYAGVTRSKAYVTKFTRCNCVYKGRRNGVVKITEAVWCVRTLGNISWSIRNCNLNYRMSVPRLINAVALITQTLPRH